MSAGRPRSRRRALALGLAAAGAAAVVAGAGYAAKRVLVDRVRRHPDDHEDDDLRFPLDARHHRLPVPDGGEIHVAERYVGDDGSPRPLVLLHGIGLHAGIWLYQLHDLAGEFQVVAPETRGHGQSRAGSAGFGLAAAALDLATTLEALDLHDAIVVGHSMGGMVLMRFAADHPDVLDRRVAGLVFLATAPHFGVPAAVMARVAGAADRAWRWGERHGLRVPLSRLAEGDVSFAVARLSFGDEPSATHVELARRMFAEVPVESFVPSGLGILEHDARTALAETRTPSIVVVGSRDRITPPRFAEELVELLPAARLVVLPGCGHQVMLERRHELADVIRHFDAELRTAPGRQPAALPFRAG